MRNDQIFTPPPIVSKMLDEIGYFGENIKTKTIFEPSFGGGAFLVQIVERIFEYSKTNHLTSEEIISILDNVHGVEIDKVWHNNTIELLKSIVGKHGIEYEWKNLICADTTKLAIENAYDFVIGNPPYIRVWDMTEEERQHIESTYSFCKGNTDLYVIFFELGIKALRKDGRLCYITPNSFMRNSSQKYMRDYLAGNNLVESITDYGTVPVFNKISTYTAITTLDKSRKIEKTKYTMMRTILNAEYTTNIDLTQVSESTWSFSSQSDEKFLKEIESRKTKLSDLCDIQYGLATNADKVYVLDKEAAAKLESAMIRPVIKGSTLAVNKRVIFPYTFNHEHGKYELITEERLREGYPNVYEHLFANKHKLESRDIENGAMWYQYGRSQGIQNSRHPKIILKHIVSNEDKSCSITLADENTLVYSGMFVVVKNDDDYLRVMQALTSEEFCRYVKLVGKNMSGGYKSFNTAAVKNFGIADSKNISKKGV